MRTLYKENSRVHEHAPIGIVVNTLVNSELKPLVEAEFPNNKKPGKYLKYSPWDCLLALFVFYMFGRKRFEQYCNIAKSNFSSPHFKTQVSDDTLRRHVKFFAENPERVRKMVKGVKKEYKIYLNTLLNKITLKFLVYFNLIIKTADNIVDIDTVMIRSNSKDSTVSYLKKSGFNPLLASIDKKGFYMEGRTGNCSPKLLIDRAIENIVSLTRKAGVKVFGVRIDQAGYSEATVNTCDAYKLKFYIRAKVKKSDRLNVRLRTTIIRGKQAKIGYVDKMFGKVLCRYVYNTANKSKKLAAIITNDFSKSLEDIVAVYNERATSEQTISDLNETGWSTMPFYSLKDCSAHLAYSMLILAMFRYVTKTYSLVLNNDFPKFVSEYMEVTTFRQNFLSCAGEWIDEETLELKDARNAALYDRILEAA